MAATDLFARRATLSRSFRLLGEFRFEQRDPARFYGALADDTAAMVTDLWRAANGTSADGPHAARRRRGTRLLRRGLRRRRPRLHRGGARPRRDARGTCGGAVRPPMSGHRARRCRSPTPAWTSACRPTSPSTCRSRGGSAAKCCASTKPGGLAVLSYTVWLGPFGGHEMGLTHYLGGERAAARYLRKHGHPAKNNYGSSLFAVSAADGLQWAAATGALVAAFPRYHPRWGVVDDAVCRCCESSW